MVNQPHGCEERPFRASETGPVPTGETSSGAVARALEAGGEAWSALIQCEVAAVGEVLGRKAAAGGNADDESRIETGRAQGDLPCRRDEFDLEPGVPAANASQSRGAKAVPQLAVAAGKLIEPLRALCKDLEVPGAWCLVPAPHARGVGSESRNVMAATARSAGNEMTSHA